MIILENLIKVEQGKSEELDFYLTTIDSIDLIENSNVGRLSEGTGVQRYLNEQRASDIAKFCQRNDAIFPTPIIVSLNTDFVALNYLEGNIIPRLIIETGESSFDSSLKPFSIIDGQHRLAGIKEYFSDGIHFPKKKFTLPLIIYKDATIETSAKIFVTINANQRSVDSSTISQLFGVIYKNSNLYTVESFASTVVNTLNDTEHSPFYMQIRMLGRTTHGREFISQGTVAKKIIDRITSNTHKDNLAIEKGWSLEDDNKKIFRAAFIKNKPEEVAEFMINYFSAFELSFPSIWGNGKLLTRKAVGYSGLMKFFTTLYFEQKFLSFPEVYSFFRNFDNVWNIEKLNEIFASDQGSSESVATRIDKKLCELFLINRD